MSQKTRAQLSRVDDLGLEVLTNLDGLRFEDIQDIQVLEDKLRVLDHAVEMDLQILSQVRLRLGKTTSEGVDGLDSTFDDLISIAMSEKARISSLTKRLDGTLTLVSIEAAATETYGTEKLIHNGTDRSRAFWTLGAWLVWSTIAE